MAQDFPAFSPGGSFPKSASEWNSLVEAVRRLDNAVFGGGLTGLNKPSGRSIVQQAAEERRFVRDRFVAIIRTPVASDKTLVVRELMYGDTPVSPCTESGSVLTCRYAWADVAFDAHPLFGSTVMDYANGVLANGETVATPPSDTDVMRCFRNHDSWIVERTKVSEGGGIKPAVVLTASGTGSTITVQPMKKSGTAWVADGASMVVALWGGEIAADYSLAVGRAGWFVPLIQIDGEWYAMQHIWFETGTLSTAARGDCT